jgi:hypothetical protein
MGRDTSLLNQRCVRNLSRLIFFKTRLVVRPAADSPAQGGTCGSGVHPKVLNTKIRCVLFRTGFLSCDRRGCSGSLLRDVGVTSPRIIRGPRLPSRDRAVAAVGGGAVGDRLSTLFDSPEFL